MEVAYALVTPYSIRKSRTGSILARMLSRTSIDLVGMQMLAPDEEIAERFAASIRTGENQEDEYYRSFIRAYIRKNFRPDPETGCRHRTLMLVFKGENAHAELSRITGQLRISCYQGDTLRNAFGDLILGPDGGVLYFEPAVILSDFQEDLLIWLDFLETQPPVLDNVREHEPANERIERTLVLIKPDSWRQGSTRPGAILGLFSRTGLRIIGCKVNHMSVSQAVAFYAPLREKLVRRLSPQIAAEARKILQRELSVFLPEDSEERLAECVGKHFALEQFERLIEFMSGTRPSQCPEDQRDRAGDVASLALVYEGPGAINKIRDVLGPTDPTQAPGGTVRREFGANVMVNTAHASDSTENAAREMEIIGIHQPHLGPTAKKLMTGNHEC